MKKILITSICLLTLQANLFAWGRTGHTIVISIAYQYLTESNKAILNRYLNGLSLADASSWMDELRSDSKYDSLKKYHFINLEKDERYDSRTSGNILSEIKRAIDDLDKPQSISADKIRVDLLELIHLMGDLHQPLHLGYGSDKGGNTYQVEFNGKGTNLHKLFDSQLIEYANMKPSDFLGAIYDNDRKIDIDQWYRDTRAEVEKLYPPNHKVTKEYIKTNTTLIKYELNEAGMHLALVLNKYLGGLNPNPTFIKEAADVAEIPEISIDSLNSWYKGKTVKICTKVFSTKQIETGSRPLLLSVGDEYPYNILTVVIFNEDLETFKNSKEKDYRKKNICVTGKVVEYQGKLQIIVKKEEQIEIK